jgi:NTE family protein
MWAVKHAKAFVLSVVVLIFLTSCATMVPTGGGIARQPKIALVLGGGSAKGFAHVGVIRVLEQEKIPIHMIIGTSVGSLIGGLYAANPNSFDLEWLAFKIDRGDVLDFSIVYSKLGPVQGAKLEGFIEHNVKTKRVEDTKIPFTPIATDLNSGETILLEKGSLAKAIRASSAIPGIFVPVTFDGRTLVDGGVTNNVPCDIARAKGADIVIAVNLQKDVRNQAEVESLVDIIAQSISIMMKESSKSKLGSADVVIEPDAKGISMFDFSQKKRAMEEGIRATREAIPKIKALLSKYQ